MAVENEASRAVESEIDVVRSAKRGDQLACHQLFKRYGSPILRFFYGMVGERQEAEDLMQETFTRAFLLLPELRSEAIFSSWLFGIAKNVARENARRRAKDQQQVSLDDPVVDRLPDPLASPETDAINQQLYRAISRGLQALDEDRQEVLALRVFAEKSYQEIAQITGWSLAKVKTEIHRARLQMRDMLKPCL